MSQQDFVPWRVVQQASSSGNPPVSTRGSKGRVLVVDDDVELARSNERYLRRAGFEVGLAHDGAKGLARVEAEEWDVVLSDITMPEMDGIEMLRRIRESGREVPVLLLTANPGLDSAMNAVTYGALQYLMKPVVTEKLLGAVTRAAKLNALTRERRAVAGELGQGGVFVGDLRRLEVQFEKALEQLWVGYQPIVAPARKGIVAFEALMRSHFAEMPTPLAILDAAERLGRIHDVGRVVRSRVAEGMRRTSSDVFVNLHTEELRDEQLYSKTAPLSEFAHRITLEITERAALDSIPDVRARILRLREMGFKVAIDDLGAGYAGLTSFAVLEPDVVKIDMSLVRNVDREPVKQRLVRSMVQVGRDLGLLVIAEGVETAAEHKMLVDLGCEYFQGFLFAKAAEQFPEVIW